MTLDTRFYVLDEAPVSELFVFCQTLLGEYDDDRRGPERQRSQNEQDKTWRDGKSFIEPDNPWTWENLPDQGLPAWLMIYHRNGEPYVTPEQSASHALDGGCNHPDNARWYRADDPICEETEHHVPCWAKISLDTAYSYRDERGWGCGDLHAMLVSRIGQWCDERGIRWKWQNEFTGEIHEGYERLIDIASSGFEASAWFRTTALPAIIAHVEAEGGESE